LPLMTTTLVTFFWLETIEPWICGITFHNRENDLVSSLWSPKLSYGENDAISLIHFLLWRFLPQLPAFPASHHCSSALSSPRLNRTQDQHPHPSRPFLQLTRSKHAARFEALAFTAPRGSVAGLPSQPLAAYLPPQRCPNSKPSSWRILSPCGRC